MKPQWRKYLAVRAPRYTSFPSALHFDEQVTAADYAARLRDIALYEPLSIYVHVPFCKQLCWYCGCNMRVENDYGRALRYVEAAARELRLVGEALAGAGRPLSVHFGGGTPNYLKVEEIAALLCAIEEGLGLTDSTRLGIELDPRLIGENDVSRLAMLGFSRMSLGVQDFDPDVQDAINRIQSFDLVESAVAEMRRVGVGDISFDLVYGLPRQTAMSFADTIEKTIALSPDRVAVFGYAHVPALLSRQRLIDEAALPTPALRADLAELADAALVGAGYRRVGFDHYSKPANALARADIEGRLRRNFQGFTDDLAATTIGVGASAISHVEGLYAQNAKNLRDYYRAIDGGRLATARGVELSPRERLIGCAIQDLLCRSRADISGLLARLSPQEASAVCRRLDILEADGVIEWRDDIVTLADEARPLARIVAMALDPYENRAPAGSPQPFARAI
ncbi:MAG: oxygen-independent coproporphyrinogen III oxidase [Parvularculaceae bacterium]|nr:oxygen-independent coproporphyrinogen III oxidase [Parvularculaceae bacterium]